MEEEAIVKYLELAIPSVSPDDFDSMTQIGVCLLKFGRTSEAVFWLQKAAEFNHREAMYFLGKSSEGSTKPQYWFEKGALSGDVDCMLEVIKIYEGAPEEKSAPIVGDFYLIAIRSGELQVSLGYTEWVIKMRRYDLFTELGEHIFGCSKTIRHKIAKRLLKTRNLGLIEVAIAWLEPELGDNRGKLCGVIADTYNRLQKFEDADHWYAIGSEAGDPQCKMFHTHGSRATDLRRRFL